jgi:probable rRNA maturation factor
MGGRSPGSLGTQIGVSVDVQRHTSQWRAVRGVSAIVRRVATAAVRGAGVAVLPSVDVAVALADDAMVRATNRDWRAKDKPTNVLSFPAVAPQRLATAPFLGDVILAYETVAAEAVTEGKRFEDHLTHLVVHGVLHLLGYDHMTDGDAALMEDRERLILAGLGLSDPYAGTDPLETISK